MNQEFLDAVSLVKNKLWASHVWGEEDNPTPLDKALILLDSEEGLISLDPAVTERDRILSIIRDYAVDEFTARGLVRRVVRRINEGE